MLFRNTPGATAGTIALLGLNVEIIDNMEKVQVSARGKYLATAFLLSSDRRQYVELVLSLKNDYVKQQRNYPRTITGMYRPMVVFDPTRATPVAGTRNVGLHFGNVVAHSEGSGNEDPDGGGGAGRKLGCWHCGGENHNRTAKSVPKKKRRRKRTTAVSGKPGETTINLLTGKQR